MTVREASVAPIHVGGCGLISRRCVGLVANDATKWRHMVSYSCTGVVRFTLRPFAVFNACWRQVNIPAAPDMANTVLRKAPINLCQRLCENRLALGGTVSSRASRFDLRLSGRVGTCFMVSIAQPRMTFL